MSSRLPNILWFYIHLLCSTSLAHVKWIMQPVKFCYDLARTAFLNPLHREQAAVGSILAPKSLTSYKATRLCALCCPIYYQMDLQLIYTDEFQILEWNMYKVKALDLLILLQLCLCALTALSPRRPILSHNNLNLNLSLSQNLSLLPIPQ